MAVKIREVDHEEFEELLNVEGDTVPLYFVNALHFNPPLPMTDAEAARRAQLEDEDQLIPYGEQLEHTYVPVLMLKVTEPAFYKAPTGEVTFLLPPRERITYEMCNAIHPEHNAWCYRLEPRFWEAFNTSGESPLDDAYWYFKPYPEDLGN